MIVGKVLPGRGNTLAIFIRFDAEDDLDAIPLATIEAAVNDTLTALVVRAGRTRGATNIVRALEEHDRFTP